MIRNKKVARGLAREWETVRLTLALVKSNINGTYSAGGNSRFVDLSYGLILPFAFSVLQRVLIELREERIFSCDSVSMALLMQRSKASVPWVDYTTIRTGSEVTNELVQSQKIPCTAATWKYVNAIEAELVAWNIFSVRQMPTHKIDLGAHKLERIV